jgi:hypothetical protein
MFIYYNNFENVIKKIYVTLSMCENKIKNN